MLEFELRWDNTGPEDLLLTTWGVANPEGIAAYRSAISSYPRLQPGMLILVDHRALDWSKMKTAEILMQAQLFARQAKPLGRATMAVVMGSTVDFGLMRMLHLQIPTDVDAETAVFHSIEKARSWLAQRRDALHEAALSEALLHVRPAD